MGWVYTCACVWYLIFTFRAMVSKLERQNSEQRGHSAGFQEACVDVELPRGGKKQVASSTHPSQSTPCPLGCCSYARGSPTAWPWASPGAVVGMCPWQRCLHPAYCNELVLFSSVRRTCSSRWQSWHEVVTHAIPGVFKEVWQWLWLTLNAWQRDVVWEWWLEKVC